MQNRAVTDSLFFILEEICHALMIHHVRESVVYQKIVQIIIARTNRLDDISQTQTF